MLNREYKNLLNEDRDIEVVYGTMVEMFSYRFLRGFNYALKPTSIRSNRVAQYPKDTDDVRNKFKTNFRTTNIYKNTINRPQANKVSPYSRRTKPVQGPFYGK